MTTAAASAWLIGLGRVSAEAGAIVLLVPLVQWLLRKQLAPRWRSALWMLVVVRLVLPVSFETPFSIFNLGARLKPSGGKSEVPAVALKEPNPARQSEPSPITPGAQPKTLAENPPTQDDTSRSTVEPQVLPSPAPVQPPKTETPIRIAEAPSIRSFPWVQIVFAVWLGGTLVLGAFVVIGSLRLSRRLARQPVITDETTLGILTDCRRLLRVGAKLDVVESSEISTPALFGLLRLRLLLPQGFTRKLSPTELRFVLLHELAHVKRRDIPVNWLITFLQVIHWFNPLLWFGFARWRADRELACDALALEAAGPGLNKEYGRTILKLLEGFTQRVATPGLVGILENQSRLRQRIAMIAAFQPGNRWRFASALLLTLLAIVCLTDAQAPKSSATAADTVITVQDEQGRPVPGAAIEYYHFDLQTGRMPRTMIGPAEGKTVTDAKGEFTLAPSPNKGSLIVARKAGLASSWKTWYSEKEDLSEPLLLTAPTSLSGVVVDENGQPVAEADVWVAMTSPPQKSRSNIFPSDGTFASVFRGLFSARTTMDGRFRIENFPADTWAELSVTKTGFAQRATNGELFYSLRFQSGQQNIKLVVGPAGTMEGKVVEKETGRPVAGAEVALYPTNNTAPIPSPVKSGANGEFRIPDLGPATYWVSAVMPVSASNLLQAQENGWFPVVAGQTNHDVVVHATTGVLVEVTVVSTNDLTPLPDVTVSCGYSSTHTDVHGKAILLTLPGNVGFEAVRIDWSRQYTRAEIDSSRTNRVLIQMVPPRRIVGVIRDSSGAPAPGVQVSFNPGRYPNAPFHAESTTDREGRYEIALRENWRSGFWSGPVDSTNIVMARDFSRNLVAIQEFGFDWRFTAAGDVIPTNVDLVLQPGITISGSVRDTEGAPVLGAVVDLKVRSGNSYFSVQNGKAAIDAHGSFSYPALPRGRAYEAFDVAARGYGTAIAEVKVENTQTDRYEIPTLILKRADRAVSGTVLDRDGHPVAGVQVQVNGRGQPRQRTSVSDDEGRFMVGPVCDGLVQVYASVNRGNNSESGDIEAQGGDTNVMVRLGIHADNASQNVSPPVRTAGIVRDNSGASLAGVSVSVLSVAGGVPPGSTTHADGRYEVYWQGRQNGIDTNTWLLARDPQRNLALLQPITSQTTNLDLALQPGLELATEVRDTDGRGVANATAAVSLLQGNRGYGVQTNFGTDGQGRLRIAGLPRGQSYQLRIAAPGYTIGMRSVGTGDTETNLLELPPVVLTATDGHVSGQVLNAEGKPAAGVQVQVFATGKTVSTSTDSNGRFELQNVSRGTLSFSAGYPIRNSSALSNSGRASGKSGDTNILIRLGTQPSSPDLSPNVKTSGTVFDASGVAAAGVAVAILPDGSLSRPAQTDAGGSYSVAWRVINGPTWTNSPGKGILFARDVGHNLAAATEADPAVTNVDIHLLPGLTLSGMVQDSGGSPMTNATVQVTPFPPADQRSVMNRMPAINADAQGRFSLNALPQGAPYNVIVSAVGFGLTNVFVAGNETHLTQLDLPVIVLNPANVEVSGQVFDLDGKPCWGARVFVDGNGQPARVAANDATSDTNGHFTIRRVCAGALVVHATLPASAERRQYLTCIVEARGGDTNVVLRLHTPP